MANEIQFKRGNSTGLASLNLKPGEPAVTLDDGKLYIGSDGGNTCVNPDLGSAAQKDVGTAVGQVAIVQSDGKIAKAIVPALDSVDATTIVGKISIECLPVGALERLIVVANDTARFALTIAQAQSGDTVKVTETGLMYFIVDDTKLSTEEGYETYTAGSATAVPWSGIIGKPTTLAGYGINDAEPKITTKLTAFNKNYGTTLADIKVNGTAALGTKDEVARVDHIHPTDTSRAATNHTHAIANVTNLQATLDAKASLSSPALTGTPTAPTATAADNSTKLATTAFVKAQGYLTNASILDGGTF